jgi:hypothetical protein
MKLLLALLPAVALAASSKRAVCTPGTYTCDQSPTAGWGWAVCNTDGNWVRGGDCAANEYCNMNPLNGSPYCLPYPTEPEECSPDLFQCVEDSEGWFINVCEAGKWVQKVRCETGKVCRYGAVHGYPQCVNP